MASRAKRHVKKCAWCGDDFQSCRSDAICCSKECSYKRGHQLYYDRRIAGQRDWYARNRHIVSEKFKAKYHAEPQKYRDRQLKKMYGITADDYASMLKAQGYGCAACGMTQEQNGPRRMPVDHCHETGAVRGILCEGCNKALGCLKEDPRRIYGLARYAETVCLPARGKNVA